MKSVTKPIKCGEVVIFVEKPMRYEAERACLAKYNEKSKSQVLLYFFSHNASVLFVKKKNRSL